MATKSILGYLDENDNFRGASIHYDGMDVGHEAGSALESVGFDALVDWIETGIEHNGYKAFGMDAKPMAEALADKGGKALTVADYFTQFQFEFCWLVTSEGVKTI
jgi:hypothetical protein